MPLFSLDRSRSICVLWTHSSLFSNLKLIHQTKFKYNIVSLDEMFVYNTQMMTGLCYWSVCETVDWYCNTFPLYVKIWKYSINICTIDFVGVFFIVFVYWLPLKVPRDQTHKAAQHVPRWRIWDTLLWMGGCQFIIRKACCSG